MQPGFNMMAGSMPGFPMGAAGMSQQHQQQMMQRMQASPQNAAAMGTPTPQRTMNAPQGTPVNAMQHMTPQPQTQTQTQTPNNAQQTTPVVSTPQTPTFPTGQGAAMNGTAPASAPLSPGSESREKEICNILLELNQELLFEVFHLQQSQQELKKIFAAQQNHDDATSESLKKQSEAMTADYNQYVLVPSYPQPHSTCVCTNVCFETAVCDELTPTFPPYPSLFQDHKAAA